MPQPLCPVCSDTLPPRADNRYHPFCSARCKMVDMGKWLTGAYAVPGEEVSEDELPDGFSRRSEPEEEP